MPRIQANFHLYAENLERAIKFYRENFNIEFMGELNPAEDGQKWAILKVENAFIWLGIAGATVGLILLIDEKLDETVARLKSNGVRLFLPPEFKESADEENFVIETDWGKHCYFFDSEGNVVMLFEPIEG
jgi:predicted enzyme related to lactoylglutathione lyase